MAVWYCSNTQHNLVAQWASGHTYAVGDKVRGLAAPTDTNARVWRASSITTGISGVSEPSWNRTKGSTTTDGGVTWTEVTGNSTYGWGAAHLRLSNIVPAGNGWASAGDTIYVGSDHNYSGALTITLGWQNTTTPSYIICVNPAGSVPPVGADVTTGAIESTTGNNNFAVDGLQYIYGLTMNVGDSNNPCSWIASQSFGGNCHLDNCHINLVTTSTSSLIDPGYGPGGDYGMSQTWDTVTVKFASTSQCIRLGAYSLKWTGGGVDAGGSAPTNLFQPSQASFAQCAGLDLSSLGSNTVVKTNGAAGLMTFAGCKMGSSYVIGASTTRTGGNRIEATNISSSSLNYISEVIDYMGTMTTDTTYTRTSGATDGTTSYSWKVVTSANPTYPNPFSLIRRAIWCDSTGSKTLTIEIESASTLKDNEVWVDIDYLSSSSYPQLARVSSKPYPYATTGSNLSTSSATWGGGLSSAVKQYLTKTFTVNMKGYIYYTVKVAKASQTLYVDPIATIS